MTSFLDPVSLETKYDMYEFFSGKARVARLAKAAGFSPIAMDMVYDASAPPPKTKSLKTKAMYPNARSAMDLNESGGFVFLCSIRHSKAQIYILALSCSLLQRNERSEVDASRVSRDSAGDRSEEGSIKRSVLGCATQCLRHEQ